jgi:hypothetical protein
MRALVVPTAVLPPSARDGTTPLEQAARAHRGRGHGLLCGPQRHGGNQGAPVPFVPLALQPVGTHSGRFTQPSIVPTATPPRCPQP